MNTRPLPHRALLLLASLAICHSASAQIPAIRIENSHGVPVGKTVIGWGYNDFGQISVPEGISDLCEVTQIATGGGLSVARRADGSVVEWGYDYIGQFRMPSSRPPLSSVTVSSGYNGGNGGRSAGVGPGGTVFPEWLGTPQGVSGLAALVEGSGWTVGLKTNGTLVAWGVGYAGGQNGEVGLPAGLSDVRAISAGPYYAAALKGDGTVTVFNGYRSFPAVFGTERAALSISMGEHYLLAVMDDNSVGTWAIDPRNIGPEFVVPSGVSDVVAVGAATTVSAAVLRHGNVAVWGDQNPRLRPPSGLSGVEAISVENSYILALVKRGTEFGEHLPGTSTVRTLTIRNFGSAPLAISGAEITGAHAADFALDTAGSASVLAPGATTTIRVTFDATGSGPRFASLRILSNDPANPALDVALSGTETNVAPTDILLSNNTIAENSGPGAVVGDVTVVDANAGDINAVQVSGGPDASYFYVEGNVLKMRRSADFERKRTLKVWVEILKRVPDPHGNTSDFSQELTVHVTDVDERAILCTEGEIIPGAGNLDSRIPADTRLVRFGVPAISHSGGTWMRATLRTVGGIQINGIVCFAAASPATTMTLLVAEGDPVPGIPGAVFSGFSDPANGALIATIRGEGITSANNQLLMTDYWRQSDIPTILARSGSPAAGAEPAVWGKFTSFAVGLNTVGFTATLLGADVTTANNTGFWTYSFEDKQLRRPIRKGQPMLGSKVRSFDALTVRPGAPGHGHAFGVYNSDSAEDTSVRVTLEDGNQAVGFVTENGNLSLKYKVGSPFGTATAAGTPTKIGIPATGSKNSSAFSASVNVGEITKKGIYAEDRYHQSLTNIVNVGDYFTPVPGLPYGQFASLGEPISGSFSVAFAAKFRHRDYEPVNAANDDAIFLSGIGFGMTMVAREGYPALDLDGPTWSSFSSIALSDSRPIIVAKLNTPENKNGLWATNSHGELRLILREGDPIGSSTIRKFSTLQHVTKSPAQTRSYNLNDLLVIATDATGTRHLVRYSYY
jgi:hypothetical protein